MIKKEKILEKAKNIKQNVEKKYKLGESQHWAYYIAKTILTGKDVQVIKINNGKSTGDNFGRQIVKKDYLDMAERLCKYVEKNNRMPNNIKVQGKLMRISDYTYMFARILVYYNEHKTLPSNANVNSKAFTKPTETPNDVVSYFKKKTGKNYNTIDELLAYVKAYFHYQKYFDDHKSNKQVIDDKSGNCVDLLQFMMNYAKSKGYDCKCIHVKCRVSGTGHVFGKFKHPKHTGGKWITRDIAAVADGGSITSIWCSDGYVLAENPSWFMANLNR